LTPSLSWVLPRRTRAWVRPSCTRFAAPRRTGGRGAQAPARWLNHVRVRAGKYLQTLTTALGTCGSWLAILEGRKGVKLYSAVGPLCGVGEVHGWSNSLSLWTCSPATHRVLVIDDTTADARRGGPGSGPGPGAHYDAQCSDVLLQAAGSAAEQLPQQAAGGHGHAWVADTELGEAACAGGSSAGTSPP
jgi:hypothetical protein